MQFLFRSLLSIINPEHCSTDDKNSPFFEPIVEDEFHVLNSCSRYVDARTRVKDETLQLMQSPSGIAQMFLDSVVTKVLTKMSQQQVPRR